MTGALAGPYCTTILGDLGAGVLKVEPLDGDSLRRRLVRADPKPLPFELHRGKPSRAVDIRSEVGRRVVRALAARVDVLVEDFRVGALAKQALGYDDLKDDCPDLAYCSISGFGQDGPVRDAKGVDPIAQAYAGLLSVTGRAKDRLAKAEFPIADLGNRMSGAIGNLAAPIRVRAGRGGAYIDVPLADTIASARASSSTSNEPPNHLLRYCLSEHRLRRGADRRRRRDGGAVQTAVRVGEVGPRAQPGVACRNDPSRADVEGGRTRQRAELDRAANPSLIVGSQQQPGHGSPRYPPGQRFLLPLPQPSPAIPPRGKK
jgi:hypothetical protein